MGERTPAERADREEIARMRSIAHPVRLRLLSMLTAEPMSAAEVARALGLTHANASYHLRVLFDAGEVVVDAEEQIRGGMAKRYRYVPGGDPKRAPANNEALDRIAWAHAKHSEIVRRLGSIAPGHHPGAENDLETWVTPEVWREAVAHMQSASNLLHQKARPPHSPGAIHISASATAFVMQDEITGDEVDDR